jgi:5-methyltetrahydrofolate--homocysteine methyltransferase
MTKQEFQKLTEQGIVLLDGATGSNLRKAGMPVGICTETWIEAHPEVLQKLQRAYVEAGSDIIYAPTFAANRISLAMHGQQDRVEELNRNLLALTKEVVQGRALVAGDVTTTGKLMEPRGELTYQELYDAYREQIAVLADAGADLIVAETMMDVEETLVVLDAAQAVCDLPVICTLTLNADGTAIFGGDAVSMVESLQEMGASAVGLNCSVGPDQLESVVSQMKSVAKVPVIAKPNAGLPTIDEQGEAHYSMGPEQFVQHMQKLVDCGAGIIGGCCGTTPDYIRLLAEKIK